MIRKISIFINKLVEEIDKLVVKIDKLINNRWYNLKREEEIKILRQMRSKYKELNSIRLEAIYYQEVEYLVNIADEMIKILYEIQELKLPKYKRRNKPKPEEKSEPEEPNYSNLF